MMFSKIYDFDKNYNNNDNIHKSKALKWYDRRTLNLVEY